MKNQPAEMLKMMFAYAIKDGRACCVECCPLDGILNHPITGNGRMASGIEKSFTATRLASFMLRFGIEPTSLMIGSERLLREQDISGEFAWDVCCPNADKVIESALKALETANPVK